MANESNSAIKSDGMSVLGALAIGGAIASAVSGMANAVTGRKNQKDANATNLQINRENNEANLNLAREQNEWNLAQWNRENTYNNPANQVGRFRQAGINPYMAMNQLTNGNTSANLQSSHLANQTPTSVNPITAPSAFGGAAGGISDGVNSYLSLTQAIKTMENIDADTGLKGSEKRGKDIYNMWSPRLLGSQARTAELNERQQGVYTSKLESLKDYYESGRFAANFEKGEKTSVDNMELTGKLLSEQALSQRVYQDLMRSQANLTDEQARIVWPKFCQDMAESAARIRKLDSDIHRNDVLNYNDTRRTNMEIRLGESQIQVNGSIIELNQQAKKELAQRVVESIARTNNLKMDYREKQQMVNYYESVIPDKIKGDKEVIGALTEEAKKRKTQAKVTGSQGMVVFDTIFGYLERTGSIVSDVGTGIKGFGKVEINNGVPAASGNGFPTTAPSFGQMPGIPFN